MKPSRIALVAAACALHAVALHANAQVKLVTGEEEADLRIGRDLAEFIAAPADIRLDLLPSASLPESLNRLGAEPGVTLAVVQSDVYQAFVTQVARTRASNNVSMPPPRVVLTLPEKEVYFIARADAPFEYLHQVRDAKINVGPPSSGTAVTVGAIYRLMFGKALPDNQASFLSHEEALVKLVTDGTVDVAAIAASQPAALLTKMKPEARQYIKLLRLDPRQAGSKAVRHAYPVATVHAASYPTLAAEDLPMLAVKLYLVTLDFRDHVTETRLIQFGRSLCRNFSRLQEEGHPMWREVEPELAPLPNGWGYYPPTRDELRNCRRAPTRARAR